MKNQKNKPKQNSRKPNPKKQPDQFDWMRAGKTSFIWLMIIFGAVYISGLMTDSGKKEIEIEYTDYREYLANGEIKKGVIMGNVFHGEFKIPKRLNLQLVP